MSQRHHSGAKDRDAGSRGLGARQLTHRPRPTAPVSCTSRCCHALGVESRRKQRVPRGKEDDQEARTPSLCRSPTGGPLTLPLPPKACLLLLCKLINLISCPRAAEKGQEVNKRPQEVRVDQGYTCSSAKGQTVSSFAFITSQLCHCSMSTNGSVLVRLY